MKTSSFKAVSFAYYQMIKKFTLVAITLILTSQTWADTNSSKTIVELAKQTIQKFEKGELRPGFSSDGVRIDERKPTDKNMVIISTGPEMKIDSTGMTERLGVVKLNGIDLADLGIEVFPHAFALLDHQDAYMRVIGASALKKLSGIEALGYSFQSPWDDKGRFVDWAIEAKNQWLQWYAGEVQNVSK